MGDVRKSRVNGHLDYRKLAFTLVGYVCKADVKWQKELLMSQYNPWN